MTDTTAIELLWQVAREARLGLHDTAHGVRPVVVFVDNDGDIAVAFPGDPLGTWSQKVRHADLGIGEIGTEVRV